MSELVSSVQAHASLMGPLIAARLTAVSHIDRRTKRVRGRHCRVCRLNKNRDGYPRINIKRRTLQVNRVAYMNGHNRAIPSTVHVLHHCDRRTCIELKHLFEGDNTINMRDRDRKRRQARGTRHGRAILTVNQVRSVIADPRRHKVIAAAHGVCRSLVSTIKRRELWAHLRGLDR